MLRLVVWGCVFFVVVCGFVFVFFLMELGEVGWVMKIIDGDVLVLNIG